MAAIDDFIQSVADLTEMGHVKWKHEAGGLGAVINLEVFEVDDDQGNEVPALAMWNPGEEEEFEQNPSAYQLTGVAVQALHKVLREKYGWPNVDVD